MRRTRRFIMSLLQAVDRRVYEDALDIIEEQSEELRQQEFLLEQRGRCLGFFASVIKSGETWTNVCQAELDNAMSKPGAAKP